MSDKGINLLDDILRVINEKVNPSSSNERRYDLAELRLTFLGNVQPHLPQKVIRLNEKK